jgi:thiamine-phosphate pyrophosphorylase
MRTARTLSRRASLSRPNRRVPALPPLFFVTDPARTPDPEAVLERLPRGCGVIFRAFGAADAEARGFRLAGIARRRGLILLVGADAQLAARIDADGVHLPQRMACRARAIRAGHPSWLVTVAAHGAAALVKAGRGGAMAALLSPAFPSRSASAGRALGAIRFAQLARRAGLPVYALGGVSTKTAPRLISTGAAGIAAVEGMSP